MAEHKTADAEHPPEWVEAMTRMDAPDWIGFMCRIDADVECGQPREGNRIFASVEALRAAHPCADDCGIVEVEVRVRRVLVEGSAYA